MSEYTHRPGLWSTSGAGVLAREGDLVLLSSLVDSGLLDTLLELLTETADAGGDGSRLAGVIEDTLGKDGGWAAGRAYLPGPALLAFGPVRAGLVVTVSGTAWAEITTVHGTQHLTVGQPSLLLRCTLGSPVIAVHGGLRADHGDVRTDRFSRLDRGTVRAGSLSYYTGHPAAQDAQPSAGPGPAETEAAESPGAEVRAGEPEPAEAAVAGAPAAGAAELPAVEVRRPEPGLGPAEAVVSEPGEAGAAAFRSPTAGPAGSGAVAVAESGAAAAAESDAEGDADQPFDAVLLVDGALDDVDERPPLPLAGALGEESADVGPVPRIMGAYCKNGHFDDPEARFCAVCGISMNQQTLVPRLGPRPPLGVLVLDDGAVLQLDADYVLGREPALDASVAAGAARGLPITDETGTVSRVHALIQLVEWRVVVTDLGSANGTRVALSDEAEGEPLIPRIPVLLRPGSCIDLGGRRLRYESHRGR